MATKTANVNSRMKLDIKQQAESILDRLGIPRSVAIDMYYRQIIAHNGIPFALTLPNELTEQEEPAVPYSLKAVSGKVTSNTKYPCRWKSDCISIVAMKSNFFCLLFGSSSSGWAPVCSVKSQRIFI